MSSNPQKTQNKMCKSPGKSANFQKVDKLCVMNEFETNCTVVGSNNLHLVKKPQMVAGLSPGAYSNPSPVYPASPYSSPASLKSPSPQSLRPPTPQPTVVQQLPVMQIIHNNHHQILARPLPTQATSQPVIKLKPHLNILPKPAASPQPPPKPSVSPQIVIPTNHHHHHHHQTIVPTAQPLLLNQMPMLAQGVQFILRPQTTKIPAQMPTATATPQGLILQPGGQQLLQLQTPRSQPQMMRVLTNGMQLAPPTTTYVTQLANPAAVQPSVTNIHATNVTVANVTNATDARRSKSKKPKTKSKLDLANIMKLSGIGDDDDVQFESDASESAGEPPPQPAQDPHPPPPPPKRIGNIQISAVGAPTISAAVAQPTANLVQVLSQNFQNSMTATAAIPSTGFQAFPTVTSQAQTAGAPTALPFSPFLAPNFAINNGLMVQRNGGFKLTLGEDGRLVLQHDPTLNQDLQSQLLLQSIFGLPLTANGGLVLQPSVEHQQVQTQTIQHVQQQQVQTQTVQHVQQQQVQTQTVQHVQQQHVQTIHSQPLQQQAAAVTHQTTSQTQTTTQPIQAVQPQPIVHTVHPQQVQTIQSQTIQSQSIQSQTIHSQPIQAVHPQPIQPQQQHHHHQKPLQPLQKVAPVQAVHPIQSVQPTVHQQDSSATPPQQQQQPPPTSYVVNLTPDQLEQLKRNGQLTVNGQTIFMQRSNLKSPEHLNNVTDHKKLSPKSPVRPITRVQPAPSPNVKKITATAKVVASAVKTTVTESKGVNTAPQQQHHHQHHHKNNATKSSLVTALQAPPKHVLPMQQVPNVNHVQPTIIQHHPQPIQPQPQQPQAIVAPCSVASISQATAIIASSQASTVVAGAPQQPVSVAAGAAPPPNKIAPGAELNGTPQEMDRLIGQILEESAAQNVQAAQRVHTIQLTPQKQQLLRSVQLQIQTLSARLTPGDTEMQTALKLLFQEQSKILASGKLLSPDKVYYHNNQIIINPSVSLASPSPATAVVQTTQQQHLQLQQQQQQKAVVDHLVQQQQQPPPLVQPVTTGAAIAAAVAGRKSETTIVHQVVPQLQQSSTPIAARVCIPSSVATQATETSGAQAGVQTQASQVQLLDNLPRVSVVPPVTATVQPMQAAAAPRILPRPTFSKAQLLEQQLQTDQNGAVKPDTNAPFSSKADACKRLIRYHCYNQPVLSQKDLDKADEIFELTAKHFIDKFSRMVDKYRYLLHKESMRQVQTSELMMIDRMFLSEEQQSLMRLRQEAQEAAATAAANPSPGEPVISSSEGGCASTSSPGNEEYDEWACIQRELGCLQDESSSPTVASNNSSNNAAAAGGGSSAASTPTATTVTNGSAAASAAASSTAYQQSQQQMFQQQQFDLQHNQSNQQLPSQQQFNQQQSTHLQQQQSVSKFPTSTQQHQQPVQPLQQQQQHFHHVQPQQQQQTQQQQKQPPKRSASSDSRLETLKRFRVDKHNKKPTEDSLQQQHHQGVSSSSSSSSSVSTTTTTSMSSSHAHHHHHHHHHHQQQQQKSTSNTAAEPLDKSIDEQVQSAIDSILNLQQSTSSVLELDEHLSSILS